jgi:hypothetical protein
MSTPTDQTHRARHPEDFARPDDDNAEVMRTWTGIGAPANEYGWEKNPVHGKKSEPGRPSARPTERFVRPPAIVEFIPPPQPQRDAWELTQPRRAKPGDTDPKRPSAGVPVSDHHIVEFVPDPQEQKDPWALTNPQPVKQEVTTPRRPTASDPVSDHPIVEFQPERQRLRDPWEHSKPHVGVSTPGTTAGSVPKTR